MGNSIIGKRERRLLFVGSALIVLLALLPNLAGWMYQTSQMRFNGAAIDWPDVATHVVAIRTGMLGKWRFSLFFTPLPQEGYYIKLFYIAVGNLFRRLPVSPIAVYYIVLAVLNWIACLVVYRFIAEFVQNPKYRLAAFLLAFFSAGVGWLQLEMNLLPKAGYTPIDLWDIDPYPYISMVIFPHFAALIICQLGFILLYLRYRDTQKVFNLFGMAILGLIIQAINPYGPLLPFMIVGGLLLGDWIIARRFPGKLFGAVFAVGIVQLPLLVYNMTVFSADPIWMEFAGQNQTLSPPPVYYLLGFFWLWLLCLPLIFKPQLFLDPKRIGILVWLVGVMVLAYLPWPMQRRFWFYYSVPLAIAAVYGFQQVVSPWLNRSNEFLSCRKSMLLILLLFVASFSHLYRVVDILQAERMNASFYHRMEVQQGLLWLEENSSTESVMASAPETGLLAGVYAYQKAYVSHEFETVGYDQRLEQVELFYQNEITISALGAEKIDWIFYGPFERELGPDFVPPPGYVPAFEQGDVVIYQRHGE